MIGRRSGVEVLEMLIRPGKDDLKRWRGREQGDELFDGRAMRRRRNVRWWRMTCDVGMMV